VNREVKGHVSFTKFSKKVILTMLVGRNEVSVS